MAAPDVLAGSLFSAVVFSGPAKVGNNELLRYTERLFLCCNVAAFSCLASVLFLFVVAVLKCGVVIKAAMKSPRANKEHDMLAASGPAVPQSSQYG